MFGTITGGSVSFTNYTTTDENGIPITTTQNLVGSPIEIDFRSDISCNDYDPASMETYARYVVSNVVVTTNALAPLGVVSSTTNNNPYNLYGNTDYIGEPWAGTFHSAGSINGVDPRCGRWWISRLTAPFRDMAPFTVTVIPRSICPSRVDAPDQRLRRGGRGAAPTPCIATDARAWHR